MLWGLGWVIPVDWGVATDAGISAYCGRAMGLLSSQTACVHWLLNAVAGPVFLASGWRIENSFFPKIILIRASSLDQTSALNFKAGTCSTRSCGAPQTPRFPTFQACADHYTL